MITHVWFSKPFPGKIVTTFETNFIEDIAHLKIDLLVRYR